MPVAAGPWVPIDWAAMHHAMMNRMPEIRSRAKGAVRRRKRMVRVTRIGPPLPLRAAATLFCRLSAGTPHCAVPTERGGIIIADTFAAMNHRLAATGGRLPYSGCRTAADLAGNTGLHLPATLRTSKGSATTGIDTGRRTAGNATTAGRGITATGRGITAAGRSGITAATGRRITAATAAAAAITTATVTATATAATTVAAAATPTAADTATLCTDRLRSHGQKQYGNAY